MKKLLSTMIAILLTSALVIVPFSAKAASSGSTAGLVTASSSLNVRSSASTSSAVVAYLSKNSYVTLQSKSGSWWAVEYAAGKYGYCYADYIQQVQGSYAAYTTASYLNVRSGAGTSYGIQSVLSSGTGVVVLTQSGGWSKIVYSGTKVGYVSSTYISTYSNSPTYPSVSLAVPSYKQTDSRWSSYPLGTTGNTIGTVGCLTTAMSMAESYRTGTTITPDKMAAKLTYSASGTLYWPSNYSFDTNSGYLQTLYTLLRSGKPVLFGATGSYGQHWVVVTGYTGGGTLSAANFTVNDPGSNTRTTLQQLLSAYPTFYKIAYYN